MRVNFRTTRRERTARAMYPSLCFIFYNSKTVYLHKWFLFLYAVICASECRCRFYLKLACLTQICNNTRCGDMEQWNFFFFRFAHGLCVSATVSPIDNNKMHATAAAAPDLNNNNNNNCYQRTSATGCG